MNPVTATLAVFLLAMAPEDLGGATTTPTTLPVAATAELFLMGVSIDDDSLRPLARSVERRLSQRLSEAGHRTMTSQDLAALFDLAAARQGAGCDEDDACIAELAGSVGAERVVTASLARLDDRYRLDLTLTDRQAARVLGRGRATGRTADELERNLDIAIAALFGEPAPPTGSPLLLIGGGVGAGVGILAAAVGAFLGIQALTARDALETAGADFDAAPSASGVQALADAHAQDEDARQTWNSIGLPLVAVGGAVAVAGGVALTLSLAE